MNVWYLDPHYICFEATFNINFYNAFDHVQPLKLVLTSIVNLSGAIKAALVLRRQTFRRQTQNGRRQYTDGIRRSVCRQSPRL